MSGFKVGALVFHVDLVPLSTPCYMPIFSYAGGPGIVHRLMLTLSSVCHIPTGIHWEFTFLNNQSIISPEGCFILDL